MKIVIDIPEAVYKCVMDGTYCGTLYEELKNGVPVDTCGDCINRAAVIDRINRLIKVEKKQGTDDWGYGRERVNTYETMLHFVGSEYLHPSVEPERKTGKWFLLDECANEGRYCDQCHKKVFRADFSNTMRKYKFCPNCGAKMEVDG